MTRFVVGDNRSQSTMFPQPAGCACKRQKQKSSWPMPTSGLPLKADIWRSGRMVS
jgi:hypothetical protein